MEITNTMELKLISVCGKKRYYHPVQITKTNEGTMLLDFRYDDYLKDEIKAMESARWNPDRKCWSVADNSRNWFQLRYLMGENPYSWYDRPLVEFEPRIKTLYPQQYKMAQEAITYRQVIWAAEMGLGKTLAAIEVIEYAAEHFAAYDSWWVGPKSALASFDVEVSTWGMKVYPSKVITYDELVKIVKKWPPGLKAPNLIIFDEFSRCKSLTAQRTQAAKEVADGMRKDHGDNDAFIIGMTGTPSPKSPLDWYAECEIIKPGFIREGHISKFRDRLSVTVKKENTVTGGVYPQILSWRDSVDKCKLCGYLKETHDLDVMSQQMEMHAWQPGSNEVARLYKRMKGLVSVYFKKEWLSHLPDKQYRVLTCKVTRSTQNAVNIIKSSAKSAVQGLIQLRELSDGFLYNKEDDGTLTCSLCSGNKTVMIPIVEEPGRDHNEKPFNPQTADEVKMVEVTCTTCGGTGEVPRTVRVTDTVGSPKDALLEEILDDHDDDGRIVIYAGFTGSIDRVLTIVKRKGWNFIRVDGRGWSNDLMLNSARDMLDTFQRKVGSVEKIAFVGHPGSAGMGITLTAANEIVYFSNDFNAESRIQSEDRIHRPGMDVNKGARITDLVHLPSDLLILENLKNKRRLQDMSLGQFQESLKLVEENADVRK